MNNSHPCSNTPCQLTGKENTKNGKNGVPLPMIPALPCQSALAGVDTGWLVRMPHRKWRETRQQLITRPDLALLGCCLVSLNFLCCILASHSVEAGASYSSFPSFLFDLILLFSSLLFLSSISQSYPELCKARSGWSKLAN